MIFKTALFLLFSTTVFSEDKIIFKTPCNQISDKTVISFVGDILIHKPMYLSVINGTQHFDQIWKKTEPLFAKADFSVGNLEGPSALGVDKNGRDSGDVGFIYDDHIYSGTNYVFNYHPRLLTDLKNSGFDLLTLANNHSTDRFSLGINKTIKAANAAGLLTVGTKTNDETKEEFYKIVQVKNIRVAFIGCTEYINIPDNDGQVQFCEDEKFFKTIKEVSKRSNVDALIILPHWGVEYSSAEKPYQREVARRYLEAGATAVIGSHPHVLEPWEKYTTKDGRETMIIYSLGNFVARQEGLERSTGSVVYIGLSKKTAEKAAIYGVAYTPTLRVGNSIRPAILSESPKVFEHTAKMFGISARVLPEQNLNSVMCPVKQK